MSEQQHTALATLYIGLLVTCGIDYWLMSNKFLFLTRKNTAEACFGLGGK